MCYTVYMVTTVVTNVLTTLYITEKHMKLYIAELARERGLTQTKLREKTGINITTSRKYWHSYGTIFDLNTLKVYADILGVNVSDLIVEDNKA